MSAVICRIIALMSGIKCAGSSGAAGASSSSPGRVGLATSTEPAVPGGEARDRWPAGGDGARGRCLPARSGRSTRAEE